MAVRRIVANLAAGPAAANAHGPVDEPWGVRRFFVRGPLGTNVTILASLPPNGA